jgi:NAD(P)-dependent dehydrogenase (short-subunit alcohol dehydrogenase family)
MNDAKQFAGKAALVTGGGSGIGRAIAEKFASAGASVIVSDKSGASAAEVVRTIEDAGGKAVACVGDLTQMPAAQALAETARREFGGLHVAVNAAGGGYIRGAEAPIGEILYDRWKEELDRNLETTFLAMHVALPLMAETTDHGSLVNISSLAGLFGGPGNPGYFAAKHAVIGLSKHAALAYAGRVRVNVICPGAIPTPGMLGAFGGNPAMLAQIAKNPVGREGTSDDVANAALWLSSDAASFLTGVVLPVDGGVHASTIASVKTAAKQDSDVERKQPATAP